MVQTFATPAPITAVLEIPAGRVRVVAADRTDTRVGVRALDAGRARDVRLARRVVVGYEDRVLRVGAVVSVKDRVLGASGAVEVTVELPAGSGVEARVASAEFRTVGPLCEVVYDGSCGAVSLDEAAGVWVRTGAGDVTVGRLTGPGEIRTSRGDVTVGEAVRGVVRLRADAGNLSIGAAAGVSASLDAGTSCGRIRNSLVNADGGRAQLAIHATTSLGDITARSL